MEVFGQVRTYQRAWRLGVSQLLCLGRHTVTNLLGTAGCQDRDWSGDYRLFSQDRWRPQQLTQVVLEHVLNRLAPGADLVLALDDTHLKKTGRHVPGAGHRRDPLSPAFHCNLIWAQRFLQVSAYLPSERATIPGALAGVIPGVIPGAARCIPLSYEHAPSLAHPKRSDAPAVWQEYRRRAKQQNLSTRGLAALRRLHAQMQRSLPGRGRRMVVTVDGSYTNQTVLRGLPPDVVLIGRVRKDLKLFDRPPGPGRRRYGRPLPTPEELRQDPQVPWQTVRAYAAGRSHEFAVKTLGPVLWPKAGPQRCLRLIVVRPLGYRLRQHSRLLYRQPAYLIATDPQMPVGQALQDYLWHWGIEVNHHDEKQIVGVGQAQLTNERSAWRQPAFAVFSYALLLLAATDVWGAGALEDLLPPPKWRGHGGGRLSTQRMIQELRKEVWAPTLNQLFDPAGDFVNVAPPDTKPLELPQALASAVLYGSAA
jgi:DDE superfamily endonuclease